MRLDIYLVENKYFESRSKASDAIKKGAIKVDSKIITKASYEVMDSSKVEVEFETAKYVSRGGYKLEGAIKAFNVDFKDKIILDIGSSTGGFTDCALQAGAKLVYSVDVGTNQMHPSLRMDDRVKLFENTNILDFNENVSFDYLVMDVSFVSILHVIPGIEKFINDSNSLICLIKPQFEAGKMINKGVIKDKTIHNKILDNISRSLNERELYINKIAPSPIKGGSGNIEFISQISRHKTLINNFRNIVDEAHRR